MGVCGVPGDQGSQALPQGFQLGVRWMSQIFRVYSAYLSFYPSSSSFYPPQCLRVSLDPAPSGSGSLCCCSGVSRRGDEEMVSLVMKAPLLSGVGSGDWVLDCEGGCGGVHGRRKREGTRWSK